MKAKVAKQQIMNMQKELAQKEDRNLFHAWEKIQNNIRAIRNDMKDADLSDFMKRELNNDLLCLVEKKK